jgi:uncharacterized protein (TIGR03663 family)
VVLAAAFRLPRLAARPMHADEANQALKAADLWQTGNYRYDTADHHGPSLYWLTLPSLRLSGARDLAATTESAYRAVPLLFGIALLGLMLLLADGLGLPAVAAAGVLTAISPALVYFSRYYIQEMLLVFFTTALLASAWRYVRSGSVAWALAAGAALGMMHATKETWVLSAAAMLAAAALTLAWGRWQDGKAAGANVSGTRRVPMAGGTRRVPATLALLAALATACLVAAAFYTSLGTNPQGLWDSIRAYANYWHRGREAVEHRQVWYYYLQILFAYRPGRGFFWTEGLIGGLALVGLVVCLRPRASSAGAATAPSLSLGLLRFLAFYTLLVTLLYAVIPYKTPWCAIEFLHPMTLLAGVAVQAVFRRFSSLPARAIVAAALVAGTLQLGWQSYQLNFRFAADPRNPYVYAHTPPDLVRLADRLELAAQRLPAGHDMLIHVVAENYWPLPWYLRRFNPERVGYWRSAAEWRQASGPGPPPAVILATADFEPAVETGLHCDYNRQMMCALRPGVLLRVYVRQDLWPAMIGPLPAG